MKKVFASLIIIFTSLSSFAQNRFDVFYVSGNYNFMQTPLSGDSKNYEAALTSNLSIPIVLKDSSIWYTSVDYQYFAVDNEFSVTSPMERLNLHGIILRTGYIYRFNSKQALHILFAPRLMGDFNASISKTLQLGGIVMYEKIKSPDLTWRIGALYNQEFFGTYIVPVVYLDWNMTQKIKLKGLLPIYAKLYMEPSEKFSAGIHFIGLTTTYRINETNLEDYYVDRRSIDLSLFSNVHIWNNIYIEGRAGYSLSRDYGLFAENDKMDLGLPLVNIGDDRVRANNEFDSSPFIHLRLIYSLPVD